MQHAVASIFRLREIESFVHDCESKYLDARLKVTALNIALNVMNRNWFVDKFEFDFYECVYVNGALSRFLTYFYCQFDKDVYICKIQI